MNKYIKAVDSFNTENMYQNDFFLTWEKSKDELAAVFAVADALRDLRERGISAKVFDSGLAISLFRDNSTRTRMSFASACNLLGLEVQDLDEGKSQIAHGETVRETANMISFMADVIGIRDDMYIGKGNAYMHEVSQAVRQDWSPTVRPPRLGGNIRMGVFATRSPFRPNNLGLSCVRLLSVEQTERDGTVLHVAGADLMDGTPIFDIKPYIPYSDAFPNAAGGFTDTADDFLLDVSFPSHLLSRLPMRKQQAAIGVLSHDPRPSYQKKPDRIYGLTFAGFDIRFTVNEKTLTVIDVTKVL